jgi:hypothetical protein
MADADSKNRKEKDLPERAQAYLSLYPHRCSPRAPQPCREIPVELTSGGVRARMRPDLSIAAALPPLGGNVRVVTARELGKHAPPGRQCRDGW